MAKKIASFFLIILFFSLISIAAQIHNASAISLNEIGNAADSLKNIKSSPVAEDIGLIASTIRSLTKTYQSVKTQITGIANYFQKIFRLAKEAWGKIESGGIKIKKYIEEKINFISIKYNINFSLTEII